MGKVDQISRKYISRQDVFADIVNTMEYAGERVILPDMLKDEGIFNEKDWNGPRTLHDMLDMKDWTEEEKRRIPDYQLSILEPSQMTEEQLENMHSDLGIVLGFIKYSTDKEKLKDYLQQHKEFTAMANESVRLLNEVCSLHLDLLSDNEKEDKGETDMCKAIEDMKYDAR